MERRDFLAAICAAPFVIKEALAARPEQTVEKIVVPFQRADVVNSNKRMYPRAVLEKAIAEFKDKPLMGHIGMDRRGKSQAAIWFDEVSHQLDNLRFQMVEGHEWLCGDLKILDTPNGERLRTMWECDKDQVAFRTAGIGSCITNENGVDVVSGSYQLVCVNMVPADQACRWV